VITDNRNGDFILFMPASAWLLQALEPNAEPSVKHAPAINSRRFMCIRFFSSSMRLLWTKVLTF
jgi:hypothetical protein